MRLTRAATVLVVACLFLTLPASALAHAELVSSSPADGEELSVPPTELRFVFTERPQPDAVSVRLFDRRGMELDLGEPAVDAKLPTTVVVAINRELRPGPYTVVWSVVSAEDQHPVSREFVFGIEEVAGRPSVTAAELDGGGGVAVAGRLLALLGLLFVIGAAVQGAWFSLSQKRMAYLIAGGALAVANGLLVNAFATSLLSSSRQAALAWLDAPLIAGLVLAGVVFVAAALATARQPERTRALWLLVLLAGFGLTWIMASKSHAAGPGILLWVNLVWQGIDVAVARPELYGAFPHVFGLARQLNILVAALHTLAVSAWIGGLIAAAIAGLRREQVAEWHPRFSRFALRAFTVVALTGVYQAVLYLSSPSSVVDSEYGVALLGKHVFVVGVLALAGVNRFVIGPALRRGTRRLRDRAVAVVRTEAALGVLVIGAATVLAVTPPARPPTDIFIEPSVMAGFAEQRQTITGDRNGWQLIVTRASSTRHRFVLDGPVDRLEQLVLAFEGPEENHRRDLDLAPSSESLAGEGLVLTRDGLWTASIGVAGGEVRFAFEVRAGHVLPLDAEARNLWDEAVAETEHRMRSARMIDVLTDGQSLLLFSHHELVAPDRARFEILGRQEMVSIGSHRYSRDAGKEWQAQELRSSFAWPSYSFLGPVIGVQVVADAPHAGLATTVLAGYDPVSRVGYEIWVGKEDGLIHRLVMGLPGHYMINAYYDVNQPVSIEPPL